MSIAFQSAEVCRSMPDSFGTRLRLRREEQQIDLIAISERTKIKIALLEGLEMDDVSQWPSGIFRRAYIRAYAQMVGFDPDEILREFLEVHPDPRDVYVITAAAAAAAEEEYAKTAPSLRLRTIVDSALSSLSRLRRPAAIGQTMPAVPEMPSSSVPVDAAAVTTAGGQTPASEQDEGLAARELASSGDVTSQAPASHKDEAAADAIAAEVQAACDSKLETIARLCTEFGRAVDNDDFQGLLEDCAAALTARGLIIWVWDEVADALRPALVYGYSEKVLAHVPAVRRDADNATAEAFRTSSPCEVAGSNDASGALVMPMLAADGCTGVLAIELQQGAKVTRSLRATAMTLAAALTQVVGRSQPLARGPHEQSDHPSSRPLRGSR
jgi:cytoskeletal protein RodZ